MQPWLFMKIFFHATNSPGNRTTHNYPNQAHRFVQYSEISSIKEEIMGHLKVLLIISNIQDLPRSAGISLKARERLNIFMVKFQVNLRKIAP